MGHASNDPRDRPIDGGEEPWIGIKKDFPVCKYIGKQKRFFKEGKSQRKSQD